MAADATEAGCVTRNYGGKHISECAHSHNLLVMTAIFGKRPSHFVFFATGDTTTQIVFALVQYRGQELVSDAN